MLDLIAELSYRAYQLRYWSLRMTTQAGSGHPTSCLSAADIVAALFFYAMKYDPCNTANPDNDRFILSKGHAAPLLYAAWHEVGRISAEELLTYRVCGSRLEGHPTPRFPYNEAATGSLGQGLSIGLGFALEARRRSVRPYTYVLLGDSEIAEGSIWEAAAIAAYYALDTVIAILDANRLGQSTEVMQDADIMRHYAQWEGFGWYVQTVDGHSMIEIIAALDNARAMRGRPSIIIARTKKGYGITACEDRQGFHGKSFSKTELPAVLQELERRFPTDATYTVKHTPTTCTEEPRKHVTKQAVASVHMPQVRYTGKEMISTRRAYGEAIAALGDHLSSLVVLDAEVKNSTFTELFEQKFPDRFIQCFVAEQNMMGMAVGMASRGAIPFTSTFGAFLSRAYDQLRMAAVGRIPLRVVGSHAGVSIGEDGPSQMALEDIALMRALPESIVLYPCDAVSTWKLVAVMAEHTDGISYLRLTRGPTPVIYTADHQFIVGGAAIVREAQNPQACIIAAGITVFEAIKAARQLKLDGIESTVIDCYSIKPLPISLLREQIQRAGGYCITVEDHYPAGGLGEAIAYALRNDQICMKSLAVTMLPMSGSPEDLLRYAEIDAYAIVAATVSLLK